MKNKLLEKSIEGARETAGYFVDELKLIFSDAGAVLLFMIAMVIYPMLYAISYNKEVLKDVPVAVVDLDHSQISRQYSRMADATEQMEVVYKPLSIKEAEQLYYEGKVKGVILLPDGLEKDILGGKQTTVTVYCDASNFLIYKQALTGTTFVNSTLNAGIEVKRFLAEGKNFNQALEMQEPLKVNAYNLFNAPGGYGSFIMPGMLMIILQQTLLVGIGMLGGTIREKKIFLKMSGKARYHLGSVRLVFGKASAYTFIYCINALFVLGVLYSWYQYPDRGNFLTVASLYIPFILSVSFLGLAVSMFFRERVHSMLFMVFLSPIVVFLSGLSWPTSAISPALYGLAHIFPTTIMVPAYLKVRTSGANLADVKTEYCLLIAQAVIYFILAVFSYRYAIRKFGRRKNPAISKT